MGVTSYPVALAIDYPERPLDRPTTALRPFVAIPIVVLLGTVRSPRGLFDFVIGVGRWHLRVLAYAFALVTDVYPPFRVTP